MATEEIEVTGVEEEVSGESIFKQSFKNILMNQLNIIYI